MPILTQKQPHADTVVSSPCLSSNQQASALTPVRHTPGAQSAQRTPQDDLKPHAAHATVEASTYGGHNFSNLAMYPQPPAKMQPKLILGSPKDRFEAEAERVADTVTRMPARAMPGAHASLRQPTQIEAKAPTGSTTASSASSHIAPSIQAQIHALRGRGQPLAPAERAFFEPRFGYDFGQVRIHSSTQASASARALRARAFTTGPDIVFGAGQYTSQQPAGRQLLAHELTHVVQQGQPHNRTTALPMTVQRAPDEPAVAPAVPPPTHTDPLLDEQAMANVAREGAAQLDAYLTVYTLGCERLKSSISLSEALSAGRMPLFSPEYEATIATIRTQALDALRQAQGALETLDPAAKRAWGGAALEGVDVAITAIEDGNDIVFIVDSRTPEGQAALASIDHFKQQLAIRSQGFRNETGDPARVSGGLSQHVGQIDPNREETTPRPEHRSVSILDIGALYDNRALENFVGPIQDPPGTLHIQIDTAAAVDLRAIFLHEVGGHALEFKTPVDEEARKRGDRISKSVKESHKKLEEMLVDNMVNKVVFFSFIGDDVSRDMIRTLAE